MKHFLLISVFGLVAAVAFAQGDPVVMTVNGVPVTRSEFEYSYNKNNNEVVIDRKTVFMLYKEDKMFGRKGLMRGFDPLIDSY